MNPTTHNTADPTAAVPIRRLAVGQATVWTTVRTAFPLRFHPRGYLLAAALLAAVGLVEAAMSGVAR